MIVPQGRQLSAISRLCTCTSPSGLRTMSMTIGTWVCNWLVELLSTKLQLRTSVPNSSHMGVNAKSLAANILRCTDIYQITVCSNAVHHVWHHMAPAVPMSDPDCKSKAHTIKAYFKCLWKICVLVIPCHGKAVPSSS